MLKFKTAMAAAMALAATSALADELQSLRGAWVMAGMDCAETFVKEGSGWKFKDRNSSLNTGLLLQGNQILSPGATCTLSRVRSKGDHLVASLGCADAIMFNEVSVSFKILDADHFQRFDPDFPESAVTYQRCTQ
ncbi:MAG: hypothetical protein JNL61_17975 [Rhizobiaceae bacterium]|nr:hypothetical protein [Rhizobiaceae bacterium]